MNIFLPLLKITIKYSIFQIRAQGAARLAESRRDPLPLDEICACGCKFSRKINMARWIYQRPIECCHSTELLVAKRLALLSDEWVIRWGFYYDTDREGDFLILGPTGGVLVLEVKGGELRKLSTTGRWEGPDHDHPLKQLSAEWHAIILRLQETADGNAVPFVAKALCLAGLTIDPKISAYKEIDRNLIVDRGDLAAFETTWGRLFARRVVILSQRKSE
jgi:hypothetical protein